MNKITLKLNKVSLRGYPRGSIITVDEADKYWQQCLKDCEGTDYIEIVEPTSVPVPKPKLSKKEN